MGIFQRAVAAILISSFVFVVLSIVNYIGLPLFSGLLGEAGIILLAILTFNEICFVKL